MSFKEANLAVAAKLGSTFRAYCATTATHNECEATQLATAQVTREIKLRSRELASTCDLFYLFVRSRLMINLSAGLALFVDFNIGHLLGQSPQQHVLVRIYVFASSDGLVSLIKEKDSVVFEVEFKLPFEILDDLLGADCCA